VPSINDVAYYEIAQLYKESIIFSAGHIEGYGQLDSMEM
jgi:hypothetical protein